ncbi:hypothetical protein B0H13DRAFT_2289961 [Mycena leptocephala]|nr:hypothetical protein B0H13DRAFT_2289961 [Mycena leptocephala]
MIFDSWKAMRVQCMSRLFLAPIWSLMGASRMGKEDFQAMLAVCGILSGVRARGLLTLYVQYIVAADGQLPLTRRLRHLSEASESLCGSPPREDGPEIYRPSKSLEEHYRLFGFSLKNVQSVKQNKDDCTKLMEQTVDLLNAIIAVHITSDACAELPPSVLHDIGKFTSTLHKIHTFVEAQQTGSTLKRIFRQAEMSNLLKDCKAGLQQGFESFQIHTAKFAVEITERQQEMQKKHQEVLKMIEALSDTTSSEKASTHRFFVACDSTTSKVELAATIGAHLGLKPGKDASQLVIKHFSGGPPSLLILDNLETLWEPTEYCSEVEEFLSLLTNVDHLALIPLEQDAARQTFIDITDSSHNLDEVDKVLSLTNNMPLAVILLAHLVDLEVGGTKNITNLSRLRQKIKLGFVHFIVLVKSRLKAFPHSQNLLSLLSILPDGLSHVELLQSKLPLVDPLACKAALIRTALAYYDEHNRLKALVPIREHMQKCQPAGDHLVRPLLNYFQELLEFDMEYSGTQSTSGTVARISANYSNIQNVLLHGLKQGYPDLVDTIYCTCYLNNFSLIVSQGAISLMGNIQNILPQPRDYRLEVYIATELFNAGGDIQISHPEILVSQVLDHFKQFEDPDLECRFYVVVAHYTFLYKHDPPAAIILCQTAISLSISTGNTKRQSQAVEKLALIEYHIGQYSEALTHALEAERLARISAGLFREAQALRVAAMCSYALGNYRKKYVEARNIHTHIMQLTSSDKDPYNHTGALMNIAELDVSMGAPKDDVQSDLAISAAGIVHRAHQLQHFSSLYILSSSKEKLGLLKALQFLGDVFLGQDDEDTATSLYTVALNGFTQMDVIAAGQNACFVSEIFPWNMETYVMKQYKINSASPTELKSGTAEAVEGDLSGV